MQKVLTCHGWDDVGAGGSGDGDEAEGEGALKNMVGLLQNSLKFNLHAY